MWVCDVRAREARLSAKEWFRAQSPSGAPQRSSALTRGLAQSGARTLVTTLAYGPAPRRVEVLAVSEGAAAGFVELCCALSEAAAGQAAHEINIARLGRVCWAGQPLNNSRDAEILVFALREARDSALCFRLDIHAERFTGRAH